MGASVRVYGTKAVEQKFKALAVKVQRKVMRQGMTKGARIVRDRAKQLVPVDTGALKKSIKVRGLQAAKAAAFRAKKTGKGSAIPIGKEVAATEPHAHLVEFGTKKMDARPFLKTAMDEKEDQVLDAIAASVKEAVKEA